MSVGIGHVVVLDIENGKLVESTILKLEVRKSV